MRKERGCLTILCIVMVAVIGAIFSFDSGSLRQKKAVKERQRVDTIEKNDSIIVIKIRK